jgi:hypothetical protein
VRSTFAIPMVFVLASCASGPSPEVRSVGVAASVGYARQTAHWMVVDADATDRPDEAALRATASELEEKANKLELAMSQAEAAGLTADEVKLLEEQAQALEKRTDEARSAWKRDVTAK